MSSASRRAALDENRSQGGKWSAAALVVLVFVAFWPSLHAQYVSWDDHTNFIQNTAWQGLDGERLKWMFTTFHMGHYQPLSWLSFGLQYVVTGGADPGPGHFVNVAIHAINAVMFFLLTRRLLIIAMPEVKGERAMRLIGGASLLAAAFFAAHPLRVESVAWITERRDVLSGMLLLFAAMAYLRAVEPGQVKLRSAGWYWGCVGLLLLSCLSKAWGMSFFVVLLALDMFPLRRVPTLRGWFTAGGMRVVAEKAPMMAIGLATAAVASMAQKSAAATRTLEEWPIANRLVQACYGLFFYVKQTVWPSGHSPLYSLPRNMDPWEGQYIVAYAFVALLAGTALLCLKRRPGVSVAIFVYVLLISPVLGVLQSGDQFVADRYSYLATMPFAVLLGAGVVLLVRRVESRGDERAPRLVGLVGAAVVAALTISSYAQSTVWHNGKTLWEYALSVTPTPLVARNFAIWLSEEDPDRAMELLHYSTKERPDDGVGWYMLANLQRDRGDLAAAEKTYLLAAANSRQAYAAHQNLGIMYYEQGREAEGMRQYELAIADVERPDQERPSGGPYMVMSLAMEHAGKREEAVACLRKAMTFMDTKKLAEEALRKMGETP